MARMPSTQAREPPQEASHGTQFTFSRLVTPPPSLYLLQISFRLFVAALIEIIIVCLNVDFHKYKNAGAAAQHAILKFTELLALINLSG